MNIFHKHSLNDLVNTNGDEKVKAALATAADTAMDMKDQFRDAYADMFIGAPDPIALIDALPEATRRRFEAHLVKQALEDKGTPNLLYYIAHAPQAIAIVNKYFSQDDNRAALKRALEAAYTSKLNYDYSPIVTPTPYAVLLLQMGADANAIWQEFSATAKKDWPNPSNAGSLPSRYFDLQPLFIKLEKSIGLKAFYQQLSAANQTDYVTEFARSSFVGSDSPLFYQGLSANCFKTRALVNSVSEIIEPLSEEVRKMIYEQLEPVLKESPCADKVVKNIFLVRQANRDNAVKQALAA